MRIYLNCFEMIREVERDIWEMGIDVWPQSMQDKDVSKDPDYETKEVRAYGFTVTNPSERRNEMVEYLFPNSSILEYCRQEMHDRLERIPLNPGNSWKVRNQIWSEFLKDGKFSYTYAERIQPQLTRIVEELRKRPDTRQAIIEIHSNFFVNPAWEDPEKLETDLDHIGGKARIPCSMYYQFLRREGKLDIIYTMRSCDFLTHFPIDIWLAAELQYHVAAWLQIPVGNLSYFTGSLHAYKKDMKARGIF